MNVVTNIDQCWYKIINDKFKVKIDEVKQLGIIPYKCDECKFVLTSLSYQQNICGSRYCKDCFDKLKPKYYCSICKEDDLNNVHKRDDIFTDKAMIKDLERMDVECPDCHSKLKLIHLETHVRNECTKGWTVCQLCESMYRKVPHECSKVSPSSHVQSLLYIMCNSCGKYFKDGDTHDCFINWEVCCPYGCKNNVSSLEDHRRDCCLYHMDKIMAIMKEWNLWEHMRNKESTQCTNLLTPTVETIKEDVEFDNKNVPLLREEVSIMMKEMKDEKDINEIIKINLNNQMSNVYNTSFDGTIVWRIDNFSKVKSDAVKGVQKSIFSPTFYSSRFGYKMCLRLYPSGDNAAYDKAMSLFLVIMKGDYDELLKWPFKQKVTFILVDPEFKTNWIDAFIPSENMTSFARPRSDMNIPSGSSYFIKFEDMNQNAYKYAKDNTMFIKCIVDCSDLRDKFDFESS